MSKVLSTLQEFQDFGATVQTARGEELEQVYLRNNFFIAIVGYKILKDFARFTSHEDLSMDVLEYHGKSRIYLTGLKRRAVYRRASEAILRQHDPKYSCATPDHQCMQCYNCFAYGGVIAVQNETKAIRSRIKTTTSFSVQNDEESIIDEPEFHNMIHRDLRMAEGAEEKKASIYEMVLIKPGVIFPFIDIIFNPTKFDIAMYCETVRRADAEGYGSRSSLLGTMDTKIVAITDDLRISQAELLDGIKVEGTKIDDHQFVGLFRPDELVSYEELDGIRLELPALIEKNRMQIFGREK
jgi:CRISPR type I-D-associated protein Csc2